MKKILFIIFICICITGYSQEFQKIKGKIINKKDSTIVCFASIYIENTSMGTISNQDGFFEINIQKDYLQNNLVLSCIGYESQTINIQNAEKNTNNIFYLNPIYYQINEVVVKPISNIKDTVLKAYKLIYKNYDLSNCEMDGFFRHYVKHEGKYDRFIESALKIQNIKYANKKDDDKTEHLKVKLIATRKSEDLTNERNTFISPHTVLKRLIPYLSPNNYNFKLQEISVYEGNQVYIIKFEPKSKIKPKNAPYVGLITIDVNDLAFIEINYSFSTDFLESISGEIWMKYEGKYRRFNRIYTYDHKKRQFQKLNGKWYLKYTNLDFGVNLYLEKKNIELVGEMYSELLINNITKTDLETFNSNEIIDPEVDLFSVQSEYNKEFWDTYNVLVKTQKERQIIDEINDRNN